TTGERTAVVCRLSSVDSPGVRCRVLDRLHDVLVTRATAEVAFERVPDLLVGRMRVALEQRHARQDHARRAVAALQTVFLPESLLNRVQFAVLRQTFDRQDLRAVGLDRED